VGKTASARQYARWDELEAVLGPPPHRHDGIPPPNSGPWQTILYTPGVVNTPRIIERDVGGLWRAVFGLARRAIVGHPDPERGPRPPDLIVVDEADRLKTAGLEQLRDLYDRRHIALVLIGMPGLQKRLARYAQLYSRVGFVHQFQPLSGREFQNVVERQWVQLQLDSAMDQAWMPRFSTPSRASREGTFGSSSAYLRRSIASSLSIALRPSQPTWSMPRARVWSLARSDDCGASYPDSITPHSVQSHTRVRRSGDCCVRGVHG
jgi:AAA domain